MISCGGNQFFVLFKSGDVFSWGEGITGATGLGKLQNQTTPLKVNLNNKITYLDAGRKHTTFISNEGDLFVCGSNQCG